jgi:hypothetical protein
MLNLSTRRTEMRPMDLDTKVTGLRGSFADHRKRDLGVWPVHAEHFTTVADCRCSKQTTA